ncbi:hypothetical protein H6F67_12005 [Microcoleus sp. FACHB-1515]|uniref:hypothetical protein n=1 Tax=Cyanophyceae TaxID=3028117 RepID=UPI001685788C|nr:hypothetical protein [Microcoleus sp. FACHB-1515]MBD2090578.1 hypothetical protein [Microcoleus sp. FACHB-1515]
MSILFTLALIGGIYWVVFYPKQKLDRIRKRGVVEIEGAKTRYSNLPLGNLGIFYDSNQNRRIQVIFPRLTSAGDVQYIFSWHDLRSAHVPSLRQADTQNDISIRIAQDLSLLMKEHIEFVEPEILNLNKQHQKISELLDLVTTSDFYAGQQDIYERALIQIENLLNKAEELQQVYVRFIREVLIGREVAAYNPDLIPDSGFAIDQQYRKIKQEYQAIKDTAIAYGELIQTRQL